METSRRREALGLLAVGCMAIGTFSTCDKQTVPIAYFRTPPVEKDVGKAKLDASDIC
jgi:hypothetical protein